MVVVRCEKVEVTVSAMQGKRESHDVMIIIETGTNTTSR